MARLKLAILISGRGSNMRALIGGCREGQIDADVALVLSNKAEAAGLGHAASAGIATKVIPHGDFPDRVSFDGAVDRALTTAGADFVCLAGFMRLLTPGFIARWRDRMINIHPSLLPAFPGLDTHRRVLEAGARITGCTVHFVRFETDTGPIIAQAAVPVLPGDDEARLADRVLAAEHRLYPMALRLVAAGRVRVEGERAVIDGLPADGGGALLINPAG